MEAATVDHHAKEITIRISCGCGKDASRVFVRVAPEFTPQLNCIVWDKIATSNPCPNCGRRMTRRRWFHGI